MSKVEWSRTGFNFRWQTGMSVEGIFDAVLKYPKLETATDRFRQHLVVIEITNTGTQNLLVRFDWYQKATRSIGMRVKPGQTRCFKVPFVSHVGMDWRNSET